MTTRSAGRCFVPFAPAAPAPRATSTASTTTPSTASAERRKSLLIPSSSSVSPDLQTGRYSVRGVVATWRSDEPGTVWLAPGRVDRMDIDERLQEYAESVSSPHEAHLVELSDETSRSLGSTGMLTGPVAGRLLEL